MEPQAVNKLLKQVLLLAAIILLSGVIIIELGGFLNGMLGALALHIILRKPYFYLNQRKKWNKYAAATAIILVSSLVILVPIVGIGFLFKNQFEMIIDNYTLIVASIENMLNWVEKNIGIQLLSDEAVQRMAAQFAQMLPDLLSGTAGTISQLLFMYFVLFFFLIESDKFESEARRLLPFQPHNNATLLSELQRMTISNVVGIPMIAVIQGVTAMISYMVVSVPDVVLLAVLTGMTSVIPVVGTALIWGPLGLYLLATGHYWQGAFIILYGSFVVTSVDNLARMMLQKRMADIHPLITIVGVIVGINIFGFIGLIFGPLVVSYLFILIRIYRNEFIAYR